MTHARETAFGLPVPAGHHAADLALQRMMREHDREEAHTAGQRTGIGRADLPTIPKEHRR